MTEDKKADEQQTDELLAKVDRELMRLYLINHGVEQCRCASIMDVLEPFYVMAEQGTLMLRTWTTCSIPNSIVEAIRKNLYFVQVSIIQVSFEQPIKKPEWMTQGIYRTSFWDTLANSIDKPLSAHLNSAFRTRLRDEEQKQKRSDLYEMLNRSLWHAFQNNCCRGLHYTFAQSYQNAFYYYMALHLSGELDDAAKVQDILHAQTGAILLGTKKDEPNTWIVMTG
ncbi:MAG: hypothetical protein ABH820_02575 [Patescibacteria group bacterium]|nr:hypothetical protein [Patescibacteria group bacterium]MBU2508921.1 hypothetical protein [Patescibacteria group bacterium]